MDYGYFDSEVTGFDDATGLPIFDRAQDSDFMAAMFASVWGSGVYPNPSDNLQVMERDDSTFGVKIMPGRCWIQGRFGKQEDAENIELTAASTTADRIDNIVVELSKTNRTVTIKKVDGVPSSAPAAPALVRTSDTFQICLAQCRVRKNAVKVNQSDIIDTRPNADLCGYVTGIITQVDTTTIFNQYSSWLEAIQAEWRAWWTGQQGGIDGYMLMSTYDPTNSGSVVDSEKLGGKAAVLYALAADVLKNSGAQILDGSLDASGSIIAPNFRIDVADGSMWFTGGSRLFRIHYDGGNNLYFHVYNANGTSVVATPLYISAAGEVVAPTINATGALKSQGTYNRTTTAAANTHISDSASGHHLYRSTSSQRWKTNINAADLEEIRKVLLKILVVNFTSLCECDDPDKVHTGFIAEQLAEIDRRMATYGTDDDGNEQVEGFDSNELISRTVAGWQIHEMEINGIKAKAAKFDALSALLVSKGILTQEEIDGLGDKA